jgi:hypothetical protein
MKMKKLMLSAGLSALGTSLAASVVRADDLPSYYLDRIREVRLTDDTFRCKVLGSDGKTGKLNFKVSGGQAYLDSHIEDGEEGLEIGYADRSVAIMEDELSLIATDNSKSLVVDSEKNDKIRFDIGDQEWNFSILESNGNRSFYSYGARQARNSAWVRLKIVGSGDQPRGSDLRAIGKCDVASVAKEQVISKEMIAQLRAYSQKNPDSGPLPTKHLRAAPVPVPVPPPASPRTFANNPEPTPTLENKTRPKYEIRCNIMSDIKVIGHLNINIEGGRAFNSPTRGSKNPVIMTTNRHWVVDLDDLNVLKEYVPNKNQEYYGQNRDHVNKLFTNINSLSGPPQINMLVMFDERGRFEDSYFSDAVDYRYVQFDVWKDLSTPDERSVTHAGFCLVTPVAQAPLSRAETFEELWK